MLKIINTIEVLPEGRWLDLYHAMQILLPILHRRLDLLGAQMEYSEDEGVYSSGQAIDLSRMALVLLHLIIYSVTLSGSRTVHLRLCKTQSGLVLRASFTLSWPPFTADHSTDLDRLCLLLPSGQLDLLVLNSLCKNFGTPLTYSLTEEMEDNLTLTVGLPITQRATVRTLALSPTEQLFLERDLEALFGVIWEETLVVHTEEEYK